MFYDLRQGYCSLCFQDGVNVLNNNKFDSLRTEIRITYLTKKYGNIPIFKNRKIRNPLYTCLSPIFIIYFAVVTSCITLFFNHKISLSVYVRFVYRFYSLF